MMRAHKGMSTGSAEKAGQEGRKYSTASRNDDGRSTR
jgi:hypothetical protein